MTVSEEDVPLLKKWVHNRLAENSEVEADDILTEYVIALLQHDEPPEQLKEMCVNDLKDFLHSQTESFVTDLISVYQSKAYLRSPAQNTQQQPQQQQQQQQQQPQQSQQQQQPPKQIPGLNSLNGGDFEAQGGVQFNPFSNFRNNNNNKGEYDPSNSAINPNLPSGPFNPNDADLFAGFQNNGFPGFGNKFNNNNNNDFRNFRNNNNFRNNRGGHNNRQNWGFNNNNGNGNFHRFNNNNGFGSGNWNNDNNESNSIQMTGGFNNDNNDRYNNNGFNKRNNRGYLQSIASTAPDDEFVKRKLVVEKIPDDKFNEEDIRAYFSQFGNISNLSLDTANHLVLIEFATHHEARAAWSSPDAIFGNRFVKVYWRKTDDSETGETGEQEKIDVEAVKQVQAQKQKEFEEKMTKKRANQEKMLEIINQKQRLIQMQKEHQDKLLELAFKKGDTTEIQLKKTTTAALQLELENLKREAALLGTNATTHHSGRSSYRGGARGGRGGYTPYSPYSRPTPAVTAAAPAAGTARFNLDLRPRTVAVSPITFDKEEAFRSYLLSIGEIEDISRVDSNTVSVTFKDRRTAEALYFGPSTVSDLGDIQKAWKQTPPKPITSLH